MPRYVFPASATHADMLAWCRQRLAEPLKVPEPLPTMRRPRVEPEPPLPEMFDRLPIQRKGERQRPAPPPPGTPLHVIVSSIFEGAISPPSPLALKRRERRAEREAAVKAAALEAKAAAKAARKPKAETAEAEPALVLTMDMGRFRDAHGIDRCEVGPNGGYVVACPPFHLHDEDHVEPIDEFLGQVVAFVTDTRALLFRRRDPYVVDGCNVGQRYVLMRFHDDKDGQAWSMPVDGEDDAAVLAAIRTTIALYRLSQRGSAQN